MNTIEQRLRQVVDAGGMVYKPRAGAVATDVSHYTADQQAYVVRTAAPLLAELGYSDLLESDGLPTIDPVRADPGIAETQDAETDTTATQAPLVWCNRGPPMRPRTKEDPGARGFMWKWELRKIVKVLRKDKSGEVDVEVSQPEIRKLEDSVVTQKLAGGSS